MSAEDTAKLIAQARRFATSETLAELVSENEKLRDAARLSRSIADEYSAERDALRTENDKLRGPDSDERDALITDPLIRQIQSLRAQLDSIRSALAKDRVILVEKRNGYTVENYADPLVPVKSIEAVLGVSE